MVPKWYRCLRVGCVVLLCMGVSSYGLTETQLADLTVDEVVVHLNQSGVMSALGVTSVSILAANEGPGFLGVLAKSRDTIIVFPGAGQSDGVWNIAILLNKQIVGGAIPIDNGVVVISESANTPRRIPALLQSTYNKYGGAPKSYTTEVMVHAEINLNALALLKELGERLELDSLQKIVGTIGRGEIAPLWGDATGAGGFSITLRTGHWGVEELKNLVVGSELTLNIDKDQQGMTLEGDLAAVFQLPPELGGAGIKTTGTVTKGTGTQGLQFNLKGDTTKTISALFGIPWLHMSRPEFSVSIVESVVDFELFGVVNGKKVSGLLDIQSGSIKDFRIALLDPIKGSDLPGIKNIPGLDSLLIENPVVGKGLIQGDAAFKGIDVAFTAINMGDGNWGGHFDLMSNLSVGELVGSSDAFLKSLKVTPPKILLFSKAINIPWDSIPIGAIPILTVPPTSASSPKKADTTVVQKKDTVPVTKPDTTTTKKKSSPKKISMADFNRTLSPQEGTLSLPAGINLRSFIDPALLPAPIKSVLADIGLKTAHKFQGYFSQTEILIQDTIAGTPFTLWLFSGNGKKGVVWNVAVMQNDVVLAQTLLLDTSIIVVVPEANTLSTVPPLLSHALLKFGGLTNELTKPITVAAQVNIHNSPSFVVRSLAKKLKLPENVALAGDLGKACINTMTGNNTTNTPCSYSVGLEADQWGIAGLDALIEGKELILKVDQEATRLNVEGSVDLIAHFPVAMGGVAMEFSGTIAFENLGSDSARYSLSLDEKSSKPWTNALGVSGLTINDCGATITVSALEQTMVVHGTVDGREVDIGLTVAQGTIIDYEIAMKGSFKLSELPNLGDIPGANAISIVDPVLSKRSISGTVSVKNMFAAEMTAFELSPGGKWGAHLSVGEHLTLGDVIGAPQSIAGKIAIPPPDFMLLPELLQTSLSALPPVVVEKVFGASPQNRGVVSPPQTNGSPVRPSAFAGTDMGGVITMPAGISLGGVFNPAILPDDIQRSLKVLGLTTPVPLQGTILGLFGGEPGIALKAELTEPAIKLFPFMQQDPSATESFFIRMQGEMFELGIETSIMLPGAQNQNPLIFDVDFALKQDGEVIEVLVSGEMRGDWLNALGIQGLTLENPLISVGINEIGGFDFLIDGTFLFGVERVRLTGDIVILPEGGFVPEAIALAGEIKVIDFEAIAEAGEQLVQAAQGAPMKGGGLKGLDVKLTNLKFALMTPGSTLPPDLEAELHIEGAGIALGGDLWIHGAMVGSLSGFTSELGMGFDGLIPHMNLGPLKLTDMGLDIHASIDQDPLFAMKGDIELFKGYAEKYDLLLSQKAFHFSMDTKWGGLFDARLEAGTTQGLEISPSNDLDFEAELKGDYNKMFRGSLESSIDILKQSDKDIKAAESAVAFAQKQVESRNSELVAARAQAQKKVNKAIESIDKDQTKVNYLKKQMRQVRGQIKKYEKRAKKESKKLQLVKAGKDEVKVGELKTELSGLIIAYGTAELALKTTKQIAGAVGVDTDPQVALLTSELETEKGVLAAAQAALEAVQAGDEAMLANAEKLDALMELVDIQDITVSGSLAGIISGGASGQMPQLALVCKIQGETLKYTVPLDGKNGSMANILNKVSKKTIPDLMRLMNQ